MEGLIQLVTESLARHGIHSPTGKSQTTESVPPSEPLPAELPEHSYRKRASDDLAP